MPLLKQRDGLRAKTTRRQLHADGLHAVPSAAAAARDHPAEDKILIIYEANYGPAADLTPTPPLPKQGIPGAVVRLLDWPLGGDTLVASPTTCAARGRAISTAGSTFAVAITATMQDLLNGSYAELRRLEYRRDVDDPKSYTKPFTVRIKPADHAGYRAHRVHL